ncbi:LysM domain-containing protein [Eubacterium sp. AF34-35BH]|uniref:LysM peptidoglycan-binding domain-containing protein n=1 Tax=Eubacterium TaxID=1730 RepID=UPI000E470FCC|nr:LysM domain-containing protein [Eubacterium sp. AF34-35BH]RHP23425.1 LysM peptidoglycan-binding domain-containing protein [Eubacterium sp. AF34-35BH]
MIEMVYSSKESEEQGNVTIPKNIRQIGENNSNQKIYVEDNVITNLKKRTGKQEDVNYGVLLGEIKRKNGNTYVFVKGMVEVREVIENSLIFNDDIWAAIYKDIKKYFSKMNIVGWFVSVPYRVRDDLKGIRKLHLDNFAGNDKVCFLTDRTENDENFYMCKQGNLEKQSGYYIYYERNEKMKKYIKSLNNEKNESNENNVAKENSKGVTSKQKATNDNLVNNDLKKILAGNSSHNSSQNANHNSIQNSTRKNENLIDQNKNKLGTKGGKLAATFKNQRNNMQAGGTNQHKTIKGSEHVEIKERDINRPKSFREILKEESGNRKQGRVAYGISGLLIIALLLSTVVMLNNYGELKNIKQTLSGYSMNEEARAVNQQLNSNSEETKEILEDSKDKSKSATNSNLDKNNKVSEKDGVQSDGVSKDMQDENDNQENINQKSKNQGDSSQTGTPKNEIQNNSSQNSSSKNNSEQNFNELENENANSSVKKEANAANDSSKKTKKVNNVAGMSYTVKKGQTLYDISMKVYGTSKMVDEIKEYNDIDDDYTIIEGQKILLP